MKRTIQIVAAILGAIAFPLLVYLSSDGPITTKPEMVVPSYIIFGVLGIGAGYALSFALLEPGAAIRGALLFGAIGLIMSFILPFPRTFTILTAALVGAWYGGNMSHDYKKIFEDDDE